MSTNKNIMAAIVGVIFIVIGVFITNILFNATQTATFNGSVVNVHIVGNFVQIVFIMLGVALIIFSITPAIKALLEAVSTAGGA